MHRRQSLSAAVVALLEHQAGVISTHQLIDGGLTRAVIHRMAADWGRPCEGIHLTTSPTWLSAAWAGLLRGGTAAVLAEEASAFLHGAVRDEPTTIAVRAPIKRTGFTVGLWRVVFRRGQRRAMGSPPRTFLPVTLVDLAGRVGEDAAVAATARALAQRRTTPDRVVHELTTRRRSRHSAVLKQLCSQAGKGIESALEWRFSQVLTRHGLPAPERQVVTEGTRIDALFRQQRLVIELDGARDHADWSKDMMRDNKRLIEADSITLRYGWNAVTGDACAVAAQVAASLASRGWTGEIRACPRCPKR